MTAERPAEVLIYTRPGCPFSTLLRLRLRLLGVRYDQIDIWANRSAAARVRAITGGDETVPTVTVGGRSMVNPTLRRVRAAIAERDAGR
jgi:mycoredoxin